MEFEWDLGKEALNIQKHQLDFTTAAQVFKDPYRLFSYDQNNSDVEKRMFCIGMVEGRVITVRFVERNQNIRIIGAGYWRKGVRVYEERNR